MGQSGFTPCFRNGWKLLSRCLDSRCLTSDTALPFPSVDVVSIKTGFFIIIFSLVSLSLRSLLTRLGGAAEEKGVCPQPSEMAAAAASSQSNWQHYF